MSSTVIPHLSSFSQHEDEEDEVPEPIVWRGDERRAAKLQEMHDKAPPSFQTLLLGMYSHNKLTPDERFVALTAITATSVTDDLCVSCRRRPALPHVNLCKFDSLWALSNPA